MGFRDLSLHCWKGDLGACALVLSYLTQLEGCLHMGLFWSLSGRGRYTGQLFLEDVCIRFSLKVELMARWGETYLGPR